MNFYKVREFRPNLYHVIDKFGLPIYSKTNAGDDYALIFKDIDIAFECAEALNIAENIKEQR